MSTGPKLLSRLEAAAKLGMSEAAGAVRAARVCTQSLGLTPTSHQ